MFTDAVVEKEQLRRNLDGGIQPLEYKLNKVLLDNLGFSPANSRVKIIPKQ